MLLAVVGCDELNGIGFNLSDALYHLLLVFAVLDLDSRAQIHVEHTFQLSNVNGAVRIVV